MSIHISFTARISSTWRGILRRVRHCMLALFVAMAGLSTAVPVAAQNIDARQAAQIAQRSYEGKVLNVKSDAQGGYTVKILQADGRIRLVKVSPQGKVRS